MLEVMDLCCSFKINCLIGGYMKLKHVNKILQFLIVVFLVFPFFSEAATYSARTVSRANCLVGLRKLSPNFPDYGWTFNESISWDPKFWNGHYMYVTSQLWGLSKVNGQSVDKLWFDNSSGMGNLNNATWRQWAGNLFKGDFRRTSPNNFFAVFGSHYEHMDNSTYVYRMNTYAKDCNLTTW